MKKFLFLLCFALLLASCTLSKKVADQTSAASSVSTINDGSSFQKAIVIKERAEGKGVDAEYDWLRQNYPGYKFRKQMLTENKKIPYDIIEIVTAEGQTKQVYFNISNFFGKF